jgi:GntR family transcriptional regulator
MIIEIEPESDTAIYQQITNQIIEGIASRKLLPGNTLPSVRLLATNLGVNMHTVHKSYHQLEKMGIISIVSKSGAIIASPQTDPELNFAKFKSEFKPLIAEALVVGMSAEQIQDLVTGILSDYHDHPSFIQKEEKN